LTNLTAPTASVAGAWANRGNWANDNTNPIGDNEQPASAGVVNVGTQGTIVQLTAGDHHTCALFNTGDVGCWGSGTDGRLGYGNTNDIGDNEVPASAAFVDVGVDLCGNGQIDPQAEEVCDGAALPPGTLPGQTCRGDCMAVLPTAVRLPRTSALGYAFALLGVGFWAARRRPSRHHPLKRDALRPRRRNGAARITGPAIPICWKILRASRRRGLSRTPSDAAVHPSRVAALHD
jgi:hypothetical protein